ncbi:hypothetical protein WB401_20050 [Streptomyces brasiliscabiei]|uniref:Uncharacterized protein n=1 Tax=Streptomyces brasiliscabiei TaxID=2736302 RepID=A0ABU8GTC4_9ACTN
MKTPTTMDGPPIGPALPREEPVPPADCEACGKLVGQRAKAKAEGDWSRVSDCNVLIRTHHPPRQGHLQAVASDSAFVRYQDFTTHTMQCDDCEYGESRCATAKELWTAYVRARDAAA